MKTNTPELKVSKAIMQLQEIDSNYATKIQNELLEFNRLSPIFTRNWHTAAALGAVVLIGKLNHNTTEALSEVERLCKAVDDLNSSRYTEFKERVLLQEEITVLKKNNSELSAEAIGLSHDKYELEKRIEEDGKAMSLSKTNFIALQKRFDSQTGALNRTNTALISAEEKYKVALEEYKTLELVNDELNRAIDNYDKTLEKREKEIFDIKAESLVKDADVAMLNERVKNLIIHSNEMEAKAKAETKNAEYYKEKYQNLCSKLEELAEQG